MEEVIIEKLVHGGQGMATLGDGRKIFVWNALPGEKVRVKFWRSKKSYAEGFAEEILVPSKERVVPKEPMSYMGSSPWQIMKFPFENSQKALITKELFERDGIELPGFSIGTDGRDWGYRNKMEYSFWADDAGLHLALFNRGSHQKQIVDGSALALPAIDVAAKAVLSMLNKAEVRGSMLKSLVVRSTQDGQAVAALFVKDEAFPKLNLPKNVTGLGVYYSNPKSPASILTKELYTFGEITMQDTLLDKKFNYDVNSFFQGNVPVYEQALTEIKKHIDVDRPIVDMYAGVGSIGLSVLTKGQRLTLVELDASSVAVAHKNAPKFVSVIHASSEKSLDYITQEAQIIFDPPRAGLHPKVVDKVLAVLPSTLIYLSCNPATQVRDIKLLSTKYNVTHASAYNFFPKTPHIEVLLVLERR